MIRLYAHGNRLLYNMDHYIVESIIELKTLTPENMGDTAFVIEENKLFMADSKLDWWLIEDNPNENLPNLPSIFSAILGKAILGKMILGRRE